MQDGVKLWIQQSWSFGGIECYITKREDWPQKSFIAKPLEWEDMQELPTPIEPREPTFRFTKEQAQVLADDLWRMGIRPSESNPTQGHLQAMEAHLKDLQRLVFDRERVKQLEEKVIAIGGKP